MYHPVLNTFQLALPDSSCKLRWILILSGTDVSAFSDPLETTTMMKALKRAEYGLDLPSVQQHVTHLLAVREWHYTSTWLKPLQLALHLLLPASRLYTQVGWSSYDVM
jgi:hypothetical protein